MKAHTTSKKHVLVLLLLIMGVSGGLFTQPPPEFDFGDAPDPYPTLLAVDGARHFAASSLWLGALIDAEADGQPCLYALGDDRNGQDDEDGVLFRHSFVPGGVVTIEITASERGYLNAWIDWQANGNWSDPGDHVLTDFPVVAGLNSVDIVVPAYAATGFTYARFRLSSQTGLSYTGVAGDGEVEDYRIMIFKEEEHKMHHPQYPDPGGWDVDFTWPAKIGDDWQCSESGPVEDIHFWVSWKNEFFPPEFEIGFHVEIYSDIPATDVHHSMPGKLLWDQYFAPDDYVMELVFEHPQGWYDPAEPYHALYDHMECYRVDMLITDDPFIQQAGNIYWLVITADFDDRIQTETEAVVILPHPKDSRITMVSYMGGFEYSYNESTDCLLMSPAKMLLSLSGFSRKITRVEIDIIEHTSPGSMEAMLIDIKDVVDVAYSTVQDPQTLVLVNQGGLHNPNELTVSAFEGTVCEIRVYMEGHRIGWKTSPDYFNDVAVWLDDDGTPDMEWRTLNDPVMQEGINLAFIITGQPRYDYGDAPEEALAYPSNGVFGIFPTCKFLGPHDRYIQHSNFGAFFGPSVDLEPDGNDGLCPVFTNQYNHDECFIDGDAGLIVPGAYSITGSLGSEVVVPCPGSPDLPLGSTCIQVQWGANIDIHVQNLMPNQTIGYVNVLIDWARDGRWIGSVNCRDGTQVDEHVLQNFLVPNGYSGPLSALLPPPFITGPYAGYVWARFTITEQPVSLPWHGNGVFEDGETEDYLLKLVPIPNLGINNYDIPNGSSDCFDATQTITMGGVAGPVTVQNGGSANFIAGQSIVMLPGTHFHAGSYVHAWIAPGGPFCPSPLPKAASIAEVEESPEEVVTSAHKGEQVEVEKERLFRVYPNPTPGRFTLEIMPSSDQENMVVEVFGIRGERVLRRELPADQHQHELSLEGQVPGIYIVRVVSGVYVSMERIIKW